MPNFFENEKNQQKNALNFPFFWKCRKMQRKCIRVTFVSLNRKKRPQLVIGFTVETNNVINNARKKIKSKKCDWMVANKLGRDNQVFGSNLNKITIVKKEKIKRFKKMTKINTSKIIIKEIIKDLIKN